MSTGGNVRPWRRNGGTRDEGWRVVLKRVAQTAIDLTILSAAVTAAYFMRFDWTPPAWAIEQLLVVWVPIVIFKFALLKTAGISRYSWRFTSLREVVRILSFAAVTSGFLLVARTVAGLVASDLSENNPLLVPRGVLAVDFVLTVLGLTGVRALRRILTERGARLTRPAHEGGTRPTLLIGAGQGGFHVAREVSRRPALGIEPVGFVDDDPFKRRSQVHGLPVLGSTEDLTAVAAATGATQALITISSASGRDIRRITERCEEAGLETKIVPGLHEIVGGSVNLSLIRPVDVEDLLRREPITLDMDSIVDTVRGRVVMVTGAGGSIGGELCRQICRFEPVRLVLVEQAEPRLFSIHAELDESCLSEEVVPLIADVCDQARMRQIINHHRPDVIFHAAAHKHVPMMEHNPGEAVKNNVLGTRVVADLADEFGVDTFVNVSTDKAVRPTSVMGATKRVSELYVQALSERSETRFVSVRFGNVLGSDGSVVPVFKRQIAAGGPVTVTHEEMTRYFMTIPEACQLVLQAGAIGKPGDVLVLDMGEPVKIVDLARDLISLSGLREGEDIEIEFVGPRPGEKMFEELTLDSERNDRTSHPKIFVGRVARRDYEDIAVQIKDIGEAAESGDDEHVRSLLMRTVPEFIQA